MQTIKGNPYIKDWLNIGQISLRQKGAIALSYPRRVRVRAMVKY